MYILNNIYQTLCAYARFACWIVKVYFFKRRLWLWRKIVIKARFLKRMNCSLPILWLLLKNGITVLRTDIRLFRINATSTVKICLAADYYLSFFVSKINVRCEHSLNLQKNIALLNDIWYNHLVRRFKWILLKGRFISWSYKNTWDISSLL